MIIDPWNDHLADHPMGRYPNTFVHTLRALHSRSGVPIRHGLRMLWSSPDFECIGARIIILFVLRIIYYTDYGYIQ